MSSNIQAQSEADSDVVQPILIDKEAFSGLDLSRIELSNQPEREFFQKNVYKGEELGIYMISSETAMGSFDPFSIEEFVFLINGQSRIVPQGEDAVLFQSGDFIITPKGYRGSWETIGGNTYHLELSVISSQRSDSAQFSNFSIPFSINKTLISGIGLNSLNAQEEVAQYVDTVLSGIELMVTVEGEESRTMELEETDEEVVLCVLAGMVTLTPTSASPSTFYTGDVFVLPKGFSGKWESEGHNLFRTIQIRAVN